MSSGGLLLLHGFTGSERSWASVVPGRTGSTADGGVALLRPALSGHDGGPGVPGVRCFEDEVDRIAALARASGAADLRLAGYSLGARIALGLLVRHRELFAAAVLIGVHPGLESDHERALRSANDERWCQLLEREGLRAFVRAWQAQDLFATQARLPPEVLARQEQERLGHDPRGLAHALRCLGLGRMPDFRPMLASLEVPVTLLVGSLDTKFCALAHGMARVMPRAAVIEVAGAGHNLLLERADRVRAAIVEARAA